MDARRPAALALALAAAAALRAQIDVPLGLDRYVPAPTDNPISVERARTGRMLFFDKTLSRDRTVSCATCHDPARGFADERPLARGIGGQTGTRRAPMLLNRAWGKSFFWDGRAATLEDQVTQPITNPIEMDLSLDEALRRLAADPRYPKLDRAELARCLATYVRTIFAAGAPYDRYARGDRAALSGDALAGLRLFRGKAGCAVCHVGPNFTDELFHNTGLGGSDPGRLDVTRREEDRGAFKTPSLRELTVRAPYMHDGSLATLEDVVDHYDQGGKKGATGVDLEVRKLDLTAAEKRALVAFLRSLTGVVKEGL